MGLEYEIKHLNLEKVGLCTVSEEELAKEKSILIEMLSYIDSLCKRNGIEYGLSGGSALGAVRHKGFIPWDDDIDLAITRENFTKLREAFSKESQDRYILFSPGEDGYYCHFPKVFDRYTKLELIQSQGRGHGLYIDLFILENAPDNHLIRLLHGLESTIYLFIVSCVIVNKQKDRLLRYSSDALRKKVKLRDFFSHFFKFRTAEQWVTAADNCFSKILDNNTKKVVAPTGGRHYFGEIWPREVMCNYKIMEFEKKKFPVIYGTDYYLPNRYGVDYMKIPPKEKREKHPYIEIDLTEGKKW